jgi:hypothetical protein
MYNSELNDAATAKRRSLIRKDIGYQWATTLLACLALAMAP